VFSAGVAASARAPDAARALIRFLASPAAVPAITASGLEAMTSQASASAPHSADEEMIRAARARSNRAIAAHDIDAVAGLWMDNVHVVSSTSDQAAGREANRQRFARQFANRPDTIYLRQPATIDVFAPWAVASERGDWTGRWTEPDGALEIGGTYQAQWRKVDGQWLIQAELYVPLRCNGRRFCAQRP
jgi:ketosteroid isomerase-like protein